MLIILSLFVCLVCGCVCFSLVCGVGGWMCVDCLCLCLVLFVFCLWNCVGIYICVGW